MTEPAKNLGHHIADGLHAHKERTMHEHAEHRKIEKLDFMEHLEREGVEAIQQIFGGHIDGIDLADEHRALLERIVDPTHPAELGAIAGMLIGIGYTLSQAVLAGPTSAIAVKSMAGAGEAPIDPTMLAAGAIQMRIPPPIALDLMKESGINGEKAGILMDLTQHSMSVEPLMQLWRRGELSDRDWILFMKLNGLDDESIREYEKLRQGPPGVELAVNAINESQIDEEGYLRLLEMNGIDRQWGDVIRLTAGASPPPEMLGRLYREGWMTTEDYRQALLESPIKNKYVDIMEKLRFRYPSMRQTLKMFKDGLIDAPTAQAYLEKLGYFPVDAENLVKSSAAHSTTAVKNLSPSTIEKLYGRNHYDRATADAQLQAIGYDATEAGLLLDLVDDDKEHARTAKAANAIGTRYVSWKITRIDASHALDSLQLSTQDRDEALTAWDVERDARTIHLTLADMKAAYKKGHITADQAKERLLASGHEAADTDILLKTFFGAT